MSDKTNPQHYQKDTGIECIDVSMHLGFCLGNAFKYMWRFGDKPTESRVDDLRKAKWYVSKFANVANDFVPVDEYLIDGFVCHVVENNADFSIFSVNQHACLILIIMLSSASENDVRLDFMVAIINKIESMIELELE
jgi:hypothetical protein